MEQMMQTIFDKVAGAFLKVDSKNLTLNLSEVLLRNAEFRQEAFDELHFPFILKGGFIELMHMHMPVTSFLSGTKPARIEIKNVYFVVGPHITDWSADHVQQCKTKLIDHIMKIYELKGGGKKKKQGGGGGGGGGFLAKIKNRFIEDAKKKVIGMLEVHISNIHFRFEDLGMDKGGIQSLPFACGGKIGYIGVSSQASFGSMRVTGKWHGSTEPAVDPLFCQNIQVRRISSYWDIGEADENMITSSARRPVEELVKTFARLNIREQFSACVVDTVLTKFDVNHKRRKHLDGPSFRERLDFHRYVVFPMTLNAHVLQNRPGDPVKSQRIPLRDMNVVMERVEMAIDSEQLRSLNELVAYKKDFEQKDKLFMTRPRVKIRDLKAGSFSSIERRQVIVAWWQHAYHAACMLCNVPRPLLNAEALKKRGRVREEYITASIAHFDAIAARKSRNGTKEAESTAYNVLRDMQLRIPLFDCLNWRLKARMQRLERLNAADEYDVDMTEEEQQRAKEEREAEEVAKKIPSSMQAHAHFRGFTGYFLVVVADDHAWTGKKLDLKRSGRKPMMRQLVAKGFAEPVTMDLVQKGKAHHRLARWTEINVGSIGAVNCSVQNPAAKHILNFMPIEQRAGAPVCFSVCLNTYEAAHRDLLEGDVPLGAVLEPQRGISAHRQDYESINADFGRLGALKDYVVGGKEVGRLMLFVFGRVGQVRMLDHIPFRKRLMHFKNRGKKIDQINLERRPQLATLDKELLKKMQRKVQLLTGKSNLLGVFEGISDGVRVRQVDHYNRKHVLCKEVSLSALHCKALRNGNPQTFHMHFHQKPRSSNTSPSLLSLASQASFGALPWRFGMLLLPKEDFAVGMQYAIGSTEEETAEREKRDWGESVSPEQMDALLASGAWFRKWGRNGSAKQRWVHLDETLEAIVWKGKEADKQPLGILPIAKVVDVVVGRSTPVLERVAASKVRENQLLSVVSTDRTLDLEASSPLECERWVAALKSRYQRAAMSGGGAKVLPKSLQGKLKAYPAKFRSQLSGCS